MNNYSILKLKYLIVCLLFLSFFSISLSAQEKQMKIEKLLLDPKLRYGKLTNGLTYYIRHNELPKERAEFYIVQNVGSMQEDENQRGLAHFLEHMAFKVRFTYSSFCCTLFCQNIVFYQQESIVVLTKSEFLCVYVCMRMCACFFFCFFFLILQLN